MSDNVEVNQEVANGGSDEAAAGAADEVKNDSVMDVGEKDEKQQLEESIADTSVMSTSLNETVNSTIADEENPEDSIVTLMDVLKEEKEQEEEYAAVLGASDEKCCTYGKGYIKRQALYACLTCCPEAVTNPEKRAGVCLACSYNCHDGHEMIELYTKRNFRCDCGTAKILAVKCKIIDPTAEPRTEPINTENSYNQNFSGVYCTCHRPYPDPEDPIDDEMIQCVICEDWFHCRHLRVAKMPKVNTFAEMICGDCMTTNGSVLNCYRGLSVTKTSTKKPAVIENAEAASSSTVTTVDDAKPVEKVDEVLKDELNQCILDIIEINKGATDGPPVVTPSTSNAVVAEPTDEPPQKKQKIDADICTKPTLPNLESNGDQSSATFWPIDWRKSLCKCPNCLDAMQSLKIAFLLDLEDTVLSYQEKGMAKARETDYDRGLRAFSGVDFTNKVNVIMGYNKMKEKLVEFLNAFVKNKQVVTEDDINRFFRMMNEPKENSLTAGKLKK